MAKSTLMHALSSWRRQGFTESLSSPRKRGSIKKQLVLLFNSINDAEHRFVMRDTTFTTGTGTLADISLIARGHDVILLPPANDVVLTRVNMPKASRAIQLKILPFMLEESLILNPMEYHFCLPQGVKEKGDVAYIEKKVLSFYLNACADAGLQVVSAYPRVLALPYVPDTWQMVVDNQEVLVRTGPCSGFATGLAHVDSMLKTFAEHPVTQKQNFTMEIDFIEALQKQPMNLLQGEFAPNTQDQTSYRCWMITGWLLATAFVVSAISLIAQDVRLASMNKAVETEIATLYQKQFVGEAITTPDLKFLQEIKTLKEKEGQFYFLLQTVGRVLKQTPDIFLKKLQFSESSLKIDINSSNPSFLQALRASHLIVIEQGNTLLIKGENL